MRGAAGLEGVTEGALRWLSAHRDEFRLPHDYADPRHDRSWTLRPLGELAQLTYTIGRLSGTGGQALCHAQELFDFAWRETRRGEVFAALVRREPHAAYPLELYAVFAEAGRHHAPFEAQMRDVARTRAWRLAERPPTRTLAVLQAEHRLGLTPHTDRAAAQARTWLGGLPEPWAHTTDTGYDATHYVFHLTNWGSEPHRLPAAVRDYLLLWLPAWLECTLEAGHWDLAGELLAVAAVLGPPGALPGADDAWRTLQEAQRPDGSLPEHAQEADGSAPEHTKPGSPLAFRSCYHSTLVIAFAAALTSHAAAGAGTAAPTPEEARR
ncbi:DUF6895 family protein [Streptomyces sp. NPDC048644]|uniref:DUF6895 family protein n=1 Tax=Streptomyces sp. NPDC048644 TaxID=3365582 RepID=UPI003713393D